MKKSKKIPSKKRKKYPKDIDKIFIPYLDVLNDLPGITTTACCTGHKKKAGYLSLRVKWPFDEFFAALEPFVQESWEKEDSYDLSVQLSGFGEKEGPRFIFWFDHGKWREATEDLIMFLREHLGR